MAPMARCWPLKPTPGAGKNTNKQTKERSKKLVVEEGKPWQSVTWLPCCLKLPRRNSSVLSLLLWRILGTHSYGRKGKCSLSTPDQWGSLVQMICGDDFLHFSLSPGCSAEGSQGRPRASVSGQWMKERASRNDLILILTDTREIPLVLGKRLLFLGSITWEYWGASRTQTR